MEVDALISPALLRSPNRAMQVCDAMGLWVSCHVVYICVVIDNAPRRGMCEVGHCAYSFNHSQRLEA